MAQDSLKDKFKITWTQLDLLIFTLNLVIRDAKRGSKEIVPGQGICHNWAVRLDKLGAEISVHDPECPGRMTGDNHATTIDLVRFLAQSWPKSRNRAEPYCFPVPVNRLYATWQGPNLELRIELMRHITKKLRDWRRRTPK